MQHAGTQTARPQRSATARFALASLFLLGVATWCAGQTAREDSGGEHGWFFSGRTGPDAAASGTQLLPGAMEVWSFDRARETRKETAYWTTIREREVARLRQLYRAQTERALQAARAKAEAYRGFSAANEVPVQQDGEVGIQRVAAFGDDGFAARARENLTKAATSATQQVRDAGERVNRAAERLAEAIENSFSPKESPGTPGSSAIFLALIAIFLLPGLVGILLFVAFRHFRAGYRLRGGAYAASGLALAALIYAAAFRQETAPDWQKLRAECREQAVTVTAVVREVTEEGAVLGGLQGSGGKSAVTDRNGFVFLFTENARQLPSGVKLTRTVYPMGVKKLYNVFGLGADMPAYTDSLERALSYRAREAERDGLWETVTKPFRDS